MGGRSLIGAVLAGAALVTAQAAGAVTFKEYSVGSFPGQQPRYIKAGPDGNLWYADGGTEGGIGRISPAGEVFARFGGLGPVDIAFTPDGTAYWAGDFGVGQRSPVGVVFEKHEWKPDYAAAVAPDGEFWFGTDHAHYCKTFFTEERGCSFVPGEETGRITGLVFDRNGNAWGAFSEENLVHELSGEFLEVDLPAGSVPSRIAIGPEGNLWVTMFGASAVDRITPTGQRTRFPLTPGAGPNDIALGPDGAFWITEYEAGKIARMTTAGEVTGEFPVPTAGAHPAGIAAGPDGAMWFTEINTAKLGRLAIDATTTTPGPGAGGAGGPSAGRDTAPPVFTRSPSLRPSRFRSRGRSSRGIPKGSSLTFTLSEASSVKVGVAAARAGRTVRGSCVGVSKSNRGRPHCTRYVKVGSLDYKAVSGANRFAFAGRVAGVR